MDSHELTPPRGWAEFPPEKGWIHPTQSAFAAEKLIFLGFTNIMDLEKGFNTWKDAGFLLE
jgi:hypothetical protein